MKKATYLRHDGLAVIELPEKKIYCKDFKSSWCPGSCLCSEAEKKYNIDLEQAKKESILFREEDQNRAVSPVLSSHFHMHGIHYSESKVGAIFEGVELGQIELGWQTRNAIDYGLGRSGFGHWRDATEEVYKNAFVPCRRQVYRFAEEPASNKPADPEEKKEPIYWGSDFDPKTGKKWVDKKETVEESPYYITFQSGDNGLSTDFYLTSEKDHIGRIILRDETQRQQLFLPAELFSPQEVKLDIVALETERLEWSLNTFLEATPMSSLRKCESEIKEIEKNINEGVSDPEEYADAVMCLFDSAGRYGISVQEIIKAFAEKLEKNKARTWTKNPNNTYSHVKISEVKSQSVFEKVIKYTENLHTQPDPPEKVSEVKQGSGELVEWIKILKQLTEGSQPIKTHRHRKELVELSRFLKNIPKECEILEYAESHYDESIIGKENKESFINGALWMKSKRGESVAEGDKQEDLWNELVSDWEGVSRNRQSEEIMPFIMSKYFLSRK